MANKKGAITKIVIGVLLGVTVCMGGYIVHLTGVDNEPPVNADTSVTDETAIPAAIPSIDASAADETEVQFQGYTEAERYTVYESEYQIAENGTYENLDTRIKSEIDAAAYTLYTKHDWATPKNHIDDYRMWRNEFHPVENAPTLSDADLLTMFEDVYNECQKAPYSDLDWELVCLEDAFSMATGTPIPGECIDQYKDWRNEKIPSTEALRDGTVTAEEDPGIYYDEYDDQYRVVDNPTPDVLDTPSTNIDTPEGLPPAQVTDWDTDFEIDGGNADDPNISAGITTIG